jgi:hydroxymethylglutaryl-CoA lyase
MADTGDVINRLDITNTTSELLAIIANVRGAEEASRFAAITYLGFPFSISETFQKRNTNTSILESLENVREMQQICIDNGKKLVIYISMGFGNPYGDPYSEKVVYEWTYKIAEMGIGIISVADTVGVATPEQVSVITKVLIDSFKGIEIGVHLHSSLINWRPKIDAAYKAGCRRFDGALKGIGGCPMAEDVLVGNMDSALLIDYFNTLDLLSPINEEALQHSLRLADEIFYPKN